MNTMEFIVRALRAWAVPLMMAIARARKAFDEQGIPTDSSLTQQLRALGREVARGSFQFALQLPTKTDPAKAETEVAPLSEKEARIVGL